MEDKEVKTLYIIIGAIGSGKSKICNDIFSNKKIDDIVYLSADAYKKRYFDIEVTTVNNGYRAADELMMEAFEMALEDKNINNIVVEFCPLKQNKIQTILALISKYKLNIIVLFVHTEYAEINRKRIEERNGSSDEVDLNKVLQSHNYVFINFFLFIEVAKEVYFIDNSKGKPKTVGYLLNNKLSVLETKCIWLNKVKEKLI